MRQISSVVSLCNKSKQGTHCLSFVSTETKWKSCVAVTAAIDGSNKGTGMHGLISSIVSTISGKKIIC